MTSVDPRYPIGKFVWSGSSTEGEREAQIAQIAALPANLRSAVAGLSAHQIETPYRDGGWTVRQLVHHVADSHMNSYIRFRLALTESNPTIKAYDEASWARLSDAAGAPIELSLDLLDALHGRWILLLRSLGETDFEREFQHPAAGPMTLAKNLALYAWHGAHHVAHVTALRRRMGW